MFEFSKEKTGPIGLEIDYDSIRMIQLGLKAGRLSVVAAGKVNFGLNTDSETARAEFVVASIKQMLAKSSFRGKNVVSCLSKDSLKIKSLRIDTADVERIDNMIDDEITQRSGLDPHADEIRYIVAGNVYQQEEIKSEVIFFGTGKTDIVRHIALLESAGLNPVAVDAAPCALFRCFQTSLRRQEDKNLVSVLVDVGSLYTTVIIGRGKQIAFVKQIPLAGRQIVGQIAAGLGISEEEAVVLRSKIQNSAYGIDSGTRQAVIDAMNRVIEELAREVSLCFRYYSVTFRGERPREAIFTGVESSEETLLCALKKYLGVEIRIAQPLRGFDLSRVNLQPDGPPGLGDWAVAIGLSIKEWEYSAGESEEYEGNRLYSGVV